MISRQNLWLVRCPRFWPITKSPSEAHSECLSRWFAWTAAPLPRELKGRSINRTNLQSKDRPVAFLKTIFMSIIFHLDLGGRSKMIQPQTFFIFLLFFGDGLTTESGFSQRNWWSDAGRTYQVKVSHKWPRLCCAPQSQKGRAGSRAGSGLEDWTRLEGQRLPCSKYPYFLIFSPWFMNSSGKINSGSSQVGCRFRGHENR